MTEPIVAVVLAGGPRDAVAALAADAPNKAFVPVDGRPLVARTIDALRSSPRIGRIIVVAPSAWHASATLAGADEWRSDGVTMSQSLRSGLQGLPPNDLALVTASDLPILSRDAIEEFLELARPSDADIVYACVEYATHVAAFPNVPHTWARLRGGTYCGGGCIALRPRALPALDRFLERLGAARKNPLRLASIFGAGVLTRYATGRLAIADAERSASRLLGLPVAAAISTFAEIAINVDRPSDVAIAERLARARRA
ncbi:MAG: nucleotidyltransferase family protein [Candidatus Eremiobacteraeota bacterium]|nr:nucleotidyltransferase family protein [Candidatus Eremiobacteraeota bacterium]